MKVKSGDLIPSGRQRSRFFSGMLLTDEDLLVNQLHLTARLRQMNRLLFGCGVVCGLVVDRCEGEPAVSITAGTAVDSAGNMLDLTDTAVVDLTGYYRRAPDCTEAETIDEVWIGLAYVEVEARPVPVHVPGADWEHPPCETSRINEGVMIVVSGKPWPECRCCCRPAAVAAGGTAGGEWAIPDACPDDHGERLPVVLARLELHDNGRERTVVATDARCASFSANLACAELNRLSGPTMQSAEEGPTEQAEAKPSLALGRISTAKKSSRTSSRRPVGS